MQFTCNDHIKLVIKDHITFAPITCLKNQFICEQRPPALKDCVWSSKGWFLKTGVTV